jgi:hypothetical protein
MTNFDADTLRELRDVQEVAIRTEKHPKSAIVIWVVADDEVFVRSWRGAVARASREFLRKYQRSTHAQEMVRSETLPTTLRLEPR